MTVDHWPDALPQITLNGRPFYVRSDSFSHAAVNKDEQDVFSVSGKRRRAVITNPKEWEYTVACRSTHDKDFLISLLNTSSYATYKITFEDGFTDGSYEVTIDVSVATPVQDNVYAWDVPIVLTEWT